MTSTDKRLQFADAITLERIQKMHPKVRAELREQYLTMNMALPKGVRLRFAQTLRTFAEQEAIYAQGRTKPGPVVSHAPAGHSLHNYGLAFDIVILYDKDGNGTFETASWQENSHWQKVKDYFKSKGWTWGGDWAGKKRDSPHFEKRFGKTTSDLLTLHKSGKKDAQGYVII